VRQIFQGEKNLGKFFELLCYEVCYEVKPADESPLEIKSIYLSAIFQKLNDRAGHSLDKIFLLLKRCWQNLYSLWAASTKNLALRVTPLFYSNLS